jgi:Leucine-rich repeat (LRR) protein
MPPFLQEILDLTPEIGELSNLQVLYLWGNDLTSLPPEIGQLTNLRELNLGVNALTSLPPEIGQLVNLQTLDLGGNALTSLPAEIGQLTNLRELNLHTNPLESPPPEIVEQGLDAIMAYLREQMSEGMPSAGDVAAGEESSAGGPTAGDAATGEDLFTTNCRACHGEKDGVGPALTGMGERASTRIEGLSARQYLYQAIVDPGAYVVEGFADIMPKDFANQFSDQEIDDLIAYLQTQ